MLLCTNMYEVFFFKERWCYCTSDLTESYVLDTCAFVYKYIEGKKNSISCRDSPCSVYMNVEERWRLYDDGDDDDVVDDDDDDDDVKLRRKRAKYC
jgi:hypothetical protein